MDDVTDVPGIRVGHWTDHEARTGCTVVLLPAAGAVTAVDVRGAAPATRETDLLAPEATAQVAHAVLLTGGSAFGLAAADGVMAHLEAGGVGFGAPAGPVPLVPAAAIYDLAVGRSDVRPTAEGGGAACRAAERGGPCGSGRIGAGAGATLGKLLGPEHALPSGLGSASLVLPDGSVVGAVAVVNPVGDVYADDGTLLAGVGALSALLGPAAATPGNHPAPHAHTCLVVVACDLALTKAQTRRLAVVAHDGLARAVRPVHTSYDGDAAFAVATGARGAPETTLAVEAGAAECVARAVRRAASSAGAQS